MKNSQLTVLGQKLAEQDRKLMEQVVVASHAAVMKHLDQDRVLIPGGQQDCTLSFARVGATILKISSVSTKGEVRFNVARNVVTYQPDNVNVSILPATEADLIDAQKAAVQNGSGADQVAIREFLRAIRNEPATPLEIRVVNANELRSPDKVISIKRGDDGKMTAAISTSLS
jgi:hypothetical protein